MQLSHIVDYEKLNLLNLFKNENAFYLIKNSKILFNKYNYMNWREIYKHSSSIDFIDDIILKEGYNSDKLYFPYIFYNKKSLHIIKHIIDYNISIEIDWDAICYNEGLITIIDEIIFKEGYNSTKLNYNIICSNKKAIHIIKNIIQNEGIFSSKLNWDMICKNEEAIDIINIYPQMIRMFWLCYNKNAMNIINNKIKEEGFDILHMNIFENENASDLIKILIENNDIIIYYYYICENEGCVDILIDIINKEGLGSNKLYWDKLSKNKNFIKYVIENERVDIINGNVLNYNILSENPSIFIDNIDLW